MKLMPDQATYKPTIWMVIGCLVGGVILAYMNYQLAAIPTILLGLVAGYIGLLMKKREQK